jgi:predicted esterase
MEAESPDARAAHSNPRSQQMKPRRTLAAFSLVAAALLLALPGRALAATSRVELRERMQKASQLVRDAMTLMGEKKYDEAIPKLTEADTLVPGRPVILYNLACALARSGNSEKAVAALEKSILSGYTDHAHMQADPDLESLRELAEFRRLVALARRRAQPKPPILFVPRGYEKDGDRTHPLFVTLHGAGGTADGMARWATRSLGRDTYFVLAPYGSARVGPGYTWNSNDLVHIAEQVAKLRKTYRIGRVYLFGFSAGGHIGYIFALKHRDSLDGFIPMAGALRRRWVKPDDLKKAKGLPVFAIQGTADRIVPPAAAKRSLADLRKHGAATKLHEHPGAHSAPDDFAKVLKEGIAWIDAELARQEVDEAP